MRGINKQTMLDLIIEAKRNDPETGSFAEWLAEYLAEHMPTLTPPNEWVNRVRELDELYTKLQIVTGFTAEQLLEIFFRWVYAGKTRLLKEICGNGKSGGSCPAERAADDGGAAGVTARENQE